MLLSVLSKGMQISIRDSYCDPQLFLNQLTGSKYEK